MTRWTLLERFFMTAILNVILRDVMEKDPRSALLARITGWTSKQALCVFVTCFLLHAIYCNGLILIQIRLLFISIIR